MAVKKSLAENLKRIRNETDLTQEKLAWKAGLSVATVSRLERALPNINITLDTLERLARALNCSLNRLLQQKSHKPGKLSSDIHATINLLENHDIKKAIRILRRIASQVD